MTRGKYFHWTESAVEMLRNYRDEGLSWPIIAGRMSKAYDTVITPNACRSLYDRSVKGMTDFLVAKADEPLPQIFQTPPPAIHEEILKAERDKEGGFSQLYYVPYEPTDEQIEAAIRKHFGYFVDYMSELHEISEENQSKAKAHGPPTWFRKWVIAISMWSIHDT